MHTSFVHGERPYRLATLKEIYDAQQKPGAPHVLFGCTACGLSAWSAKNIALGDRGGYTGTRSIFFLEWGAECKCSPSALRMIVQEETQK